MAEGRDTPKSRKTKDKIEKKKKRKHAEDEVENASPSKKAKSNEHISNGIPRIKPTTTSADQIYSAADMEIGSSSHIPSKSQDVSTQETPRRKKKQSKSSHLDGEDTRTNGTIEQGSNVFQSPTKIQSKTALIDENSPPVSANKKSKKREKKPHPEPSPVLNQRNEDSPMPMDIDPTISQLIQDPDPTPYITRTLRSILSTALPPPKTRTSQSPFFRQAIQMYLPLSPVTLPFPLPGLCAEHLSPLLLKYYPPIQGVIISYAHPRFSTENISDDGTPLAISVGEYCSPMIWVDVEFLIFQPQRGHEVEGMIVLQGENHIGVQVYNLFSGRIPKTRLPEGWKWHGTDGRAKGKSRKGRLKGGDADDDGQHAEVLKEAEQETAGYWSDMNGNRVGDVIKFWVWDVEIALSGKDVERNLPSIEGTLRESDLRDDEEKDQDRIRKEIRDGKKRAREGRVV